LAIEGAIEGIEFVGMPVEVGSSPHLVAAVIVMRTSFQALFGRLVQQVIQLPVPPAAQQVFSGAFEPRRLEGSKSFLEY